MTYNISQPAPILRSLIDVYFQISGRLSEVERITLLPDGGVNLFVNLGESIQSMCLDRNIQHGGIFLVGPMMKSDIQIVRNEVLLFGIRFKPGAFFYFHKYDSLDQAANTFHEFPGHDFPDVKKTVEQFATYLDKFYLDKLSTPKYSVLNCALDIYRNIGSVRVEALAKKYSMTERQLERQFKQQVGLPPKKLADLERFRRAFAMLNIRAKQSIQEIAWDCGYFDHAHMTNDFKRFTGQPPTAFILSDFSKRIAEESC